MMVSGLIKIALVTTYELGKGGSSIPLRNDRDDRISCVAVRRLDVKLPRPAQQ
jgi:hypothetical protein